LIGNLEKPFCTPYKVVRLDMLTSKVDWMA
jgi:hypothetical protein